MREVHKSKTQHIWFEAPRCMLFQSQSFLRLDEFLQVWLSGGRVFNVPCSHVAHIEAPHSRAYRSEWTDQIHSNYRRTAEVLLDDYAKYLYWYLPQAKVTLRRGLQSQLRKKTNDMIQKGKAGLRITDSSYHSQFFVFPGSSFGRCWREKKAEGLFVSQLHLVPEKHFPRTGCPRFRQLCLWPGLLRERNSGTEFLCPFQLICESHVSRESADWRFG